MGQQLCSSRNTWRCENIISLANFPRNDVGASFKFDNGREIGYAEYGYTRGDDAINLVFIPGFLGSRLFFPQHLIPMLKKNRLNLLVIERLGIGLSSSGVEGLTYSIFANHVLWFIEGMGIKAFHLIAYSAGTPVGAEIASQNPNSLLSLTLIEPIAPLQWQPACCEGSFTFNCAWFLLTYCCLGFTKWVVNRKIQCFGANPSPAKLEKEYWNEFGEASKRFFEINIEAFSLVMESAFELKSRNQSYIVDKDGLELMAKPWGDSLEDIKCPTLIVSDEDDPICPVDMARYLHRRITTSELSISRGYGHCAVFPALVLLLNRFEAPFNKQQFLESFDIKPVPINDSSYGFCCSKTQIDEDCAKILRNAYMGSTTYVE